MIEEKRLIIQLLEYKNLKIQLRKELIRCMYNYKCQNCGEQILSGLHIHHIDRNQENNYYTNLVPLCPSCHASVRYYPSIMNKIKELYVMIS